MAKRRGSGGTRALQVVSARGIAYRVLDTPVHSTAYGRDVAAELAAHGIEGDQVFKTLLIDLDAARGPRPRLAVAIVPVGSQLSLKAAAAALGASRATMAEPADAERATGYVRGGISPLGQKKLLPTVIDESALRHGEVFVSAGRRGLELGLRPSDLQALTSATIASITQG